MEISLKYRLNQITMIEFKSFSITQSKEINYLKCHANAQQYSTVSEKLINCLY